MAAFVLTDARIELNAVVLSTGGNRVALTAEAELQEATRFGDTGRRKLAGLKDWSAEIQFFGDEAAGAVMATLYSLWSAGTQHAVKIRQTSAAISTTNPEYQGNGLIESIGPVSGQVGEVAGVAVRYRGSDGLALVRATA